MSDQDRVATPNTGDSAPKPKEWEAHPYIYIDEQGDTVYRTEDRKVHALDFSTLRPIEAALRAHGMRCYRQFPLVLGADFSDKFRVVRLPRYRYDALRILAGDKGRRYRVIEDGYSPARNEATMKFVDWRPNSDVTHADPDEAVVLMGGDVLTFSPAGTQVRLWTRSSNLAPTDDADGEDDATASDEGAPDAFGSHGSHW